MTTTGGGHVLPRDLPSLTSLRAAAALLVFVQHASGSWELVSIPGARYGYVGVAFFFALSGFILTWGYKPTTPMRTFYLRRIARIYPSHVAVTALALLLPVTAFAGVWPQLPLNLLLLQAWVPAGPWVFSLNAVTWSLSCEIFFYACFPFILHWFAKRPVRNVVGAAVGLHAVTLVTVVAFLFLKAASGSGGFPLPLVAYANPVFRLSEFVLGIAACIAFRSGWRPRLWQVGAAAVYAFVGAVVLPSFPIPSLWVAPLFVLAIAFFAGRDVRGRNWLSARPLVYAGEVSFAFYLVHELVIMNLKHWVGTGWWVVTLCLVTAGALAALVHHVVELPARVAVVGWAGARATPPATSPSTG